MQSKTFLAIACSALVFAACKPAAVAEAPSPPQQAAAPAEHAHHAAPAQAADGNANKSASTLAYEAANNRMHSDMAITFTGDADMDFLKGMIPHHQGAIDMAKVELEHGKDPKARKLAEEIIAAQEKEIAMMKQWIAEREAVKHH